jgi:hypothetical protein
MTRWAGDEVNPIGAAAVTSGQRSGTGPTGLIGPAGAMARAIDAAVRSAQSADAVGFDRAQTELSRVDPEQLRTLLGHVSRELFERAHPDGLDSDDAEQALRSCAQSAGWFAHLDRDALVVALTGALGVSETDESGGPDERSVVAHGLLLIGDQLRTSGLHLQPLLDSALGELRRAQTMEMP